MRDNFFWRVPSKFTLETKVRQAVGKQQMMPKTRGEGKPQQQQYRRSTEEVDVQDQNIMKATGLSTGDMSADRQRHSRWRIHTTKRGSVRQPANECTWVSAGGETAKRVSGRRWVVHSRRLNYNMQQHVETTSIYRGIRLTETGDTLDDEYI